MLKDNTADHLSTSQVARKLGVSESWVRHLIDSGRLSHVSTPLGRLVLAGAVEEMIRQREKAV